VDKNDLMIAEEIEAWQRGKVTRLLISSLEEVLATVRAGYVACNDEQFKIQKGRELQTMAVLDLILRDAEEWLKTDVPRPQNTKGGESEDT
jgi:hypothetical protein